MMKILQNARRAVGIVVLAAACASPRTAPGPVGPVGADPDVLPAIPREFRGLWVATVANIDWPSRAGLPAEQQRAELEGIMDRAVDAGLNAIVLHVRPAGDALYESSLEPWGRMLTGTQGVNPGYDPLAFAVEQAHRRGLELHAWINPFRAGNTSDSTALGATHIFNRRRDLVRVYGTQLWMDPGEPDVHEHSLRVVEDIVSRYDVDGVHLDDYFYPYPYRNAEGVTVPFPDSGAYRRSGSTLPIDDWRRANVDRFVERLYAIVHGEKPWVRVGISPFGIWRPGNPSGITGFDPYAAIYADARKWLVNGWTDYFAPQLYWPIDPPQQSFTALLSWWLQQNPRGRYVWPGIATYRLYEGTPRFTLDEIVNQVTAVRERDAKGMLFYNTTTTLSRNGGEVANTLASRAFTDRAVSPAFTWLDAQPPATPVLTSPSSANNAWTAHVTSSGEPVRFWVVRYREGNQWKTQLFAGSESRLTVGDRSAAAVDWVVVNAVDRVGNLSADATWRRGG